MGPAPNESLSKLTDSVDTVHVHSVIAQTLHTSNINGANSWAFTDSESIRQILTWTIAQVHTNFPQIMVGGKDEIGNLP